MTRTRTPTESVTPKPVDLHDLPALAGEPLGQTAWREITQDDVTRFAQLTGDEQWIHLDPARAETGPFVTTIAHGYFTLSLSTIFLDQVIRVEGAGLVLNYGSNRVRFPAPVPVGSRVRADIQLAKVDDVGGGFQTTYLLTFEVEGGRKPGCVAEIVYRYYTSGPQRPSSPSSSGG